MTVRKATPSEIYARLTSSAIHEGSNMPAPKPAQTALQRLTESLPSEAEKQRLAADYAESAEMFDADRSDTFAAVLDAQRSTANSGLPGWLDALDALDRASRH